MEDNKILIVFEEKKVDGKERIENRSNSTYSSPYPFASET